jgi:hypothetical protein
MHLSDRETLAFKILSRAEDDAMRGWIEVDYIEWLGETTEIETFALSNGEAMNPLVLADLGAILENEITLLATTTDLSDEVLNASSDETDVLALWLISGYEPNLAGDLSNLRLGVVTDREERLTEFILTTGVEEIALVLITIDTSEEVKSISRFPNTRVVAGGDVRASEAQRALTKLPKLHPTITIDARIRCHAELVGLNEAVDNLLLEVGFEINDVVRHVELRRYPSSVVEIRG